VTRPEDVLERHIGESLEGAALLSEDASGLLVDLGSGNGYPGIPLAALRPGLTPLLVEASARKAAFLREVARACGLERMAVLEAQVQRAEDLDPATSSSIAVLATRAMGNWPRVVPRLVPRLAPDGIVLLWAGGDAESVLARASWRGTRLLRRHSLPARDRSWIWVLGRA
jgi:16S rRNA (guanine527-N7)-methyltransferase